MADQTPTDYITLISNDGFEFKVLRSAACIATTLRKALDPQSGFRETTENRVELPTINGVILEKVCEYLYYNQKHADAKEVPDMDIPPELCLELLMAADYLVGKFSDIFKHILLLSLYLCSYHSSVGGTLERRVLFESLSIRTDISLRSLNNPHIN
ncbi:unnamed protein product [Periconia digitata]|uniref:Elongin-C n=1 Tax=Periconia digitata TaxID=1303443 RepID=A0A9W4U3F5_9PLEO|nr:unnamed protein product [Periconia digitata]